VWGTSFSTAYYCSLVLFCEPFVHKNLFPHPLFLNMYALLSLHNLSNKIHCYAWMSNISKTMMLNTCYYLLFLQWMHFTTMVWWSESFQHTIELWASNSSTWWAEQSVGSSQFFALRYVMMFELVKHPIATLNPSCLEYSTCSIWLPGEDVPAWAGRMLLCHTLPFSLFYNIHGNIIITSLQNLDIQVLL
jgi:hypothetical protein